MNEQAQAQLVGNGRDGSDVIRQMYDQSNRLNNDSGMLEVREDITADDEVTVGEIPQPVPRRRRP